MGDADQIMTKIKHEPDIEYIALIPNLHGLKKAISAKVKSVAIFSAASETFCKKNINCSIEESLEKYNDVIEQANAEGIAVRGYLYLICLQTIFLCSNLVYYYYYYYYYC